MNAATVFGGSAIRRELGRGLRSLMWLMLFLVAFSRNFLGVHTPQDVLVGAAAGLLVMWLISKLMKWIEANPDKDWLVLVIGIGLVAAVALYAGLKPYPEDFDANGALLVDGAKMANDTFKSVGWCSAFFIGWFLEKRFVGYSTDIPMIKRITRVVIGLFVFYVVSLIFVPLIKDSVPGWGGSVLSCFLQMFYVSFIFPWCIKQFEKHVSEKSN
jgi:undecaprenyl-diphosphatase